VFREAILPEEVPMRFEPLTKRALTFLLIVCAFSILALPQTPPLASLVETERAFARDCVERGVRDSFLAFFADDAISFWPHPVNAREALLKQPAPSERPTTTLNWEPLLADVSGAGDLGYTTGPSLTTDDKQKPIRSGYYFSIWRWQSDGSWKVELDIGIKTPPTSSLPLSSLRTPVQFGRGSKRHVAGDEQSVLTDRHPLHLNADAL
jgi:ketosteroid isomerase-like protein